IAEPHQPHLASHKIQSATDSDYEQRFQEHVKNSSKIVNSTARIILTMALAFVGVTAALAETNYFSLSVSASPTNNPLKGFMPYQGAYAAFPYSMEWNYLPLRSLMTGPTNFNWTRLDALLNDIASRGHQAVFRVYLDYPTLATGIPQYLLDAGLATYSYTDYDNKVSVCPDYQNPLLGQALTNFIAALGARCDGDPRIGFITVGLLGFWGEWHTFPHDTWFASTAVQDEVLAAYQAAFSKTKLLVRYPSGTNPTARPIGYHDDSFAYSTLDPPEWCFLGLLKAAGETNKWLTQPIGGEVRPEVQLCMWDTNQNCVPAGQAFNQCVDLTHASWMLNHGVFSPGLSGAERDAALAGAQRLGYSFCASNAVLVDPFTNTPLQVSVGLRNFGVAPFYYDWSVQLGALNRSNEFVGAWLTAWKVSFLLPATTNTVWSWAITNHGLAVGRYKIAMRVINPWPTGLPLRFANSAQDADVPGWLTLGEVSVLPASSRPGLSGAASGSGFTLQVSYAAPGNWTVERSPDCRDWVPLLSTNTIAPDWSVTDALNFSRRFYRVVKSP
ncbi:MAG: hypothetical protein ACREIC_20300, partial [Limisphaerales bacterium]